MLDPLSAIIGIAQAIGTLGAVGVALWLGLRQGRSETEALYDSHRPILVPAKETFSVVYKIRYVSEGETVSEAEEIREGEEIDFNLPVYMLSFRNVGPGVALNVDGILTEPKPNVPSTTLARSYRLNLGIPIASGDTVDIRASAGGTMLHGTAQIVPGYDLYAPQAPSASDTLRGIGAVVVRLTLTCTDTFGKTHAFIYDYTENHKWVYRTSQKVDKSIEELNREATGKAIPGPSAIPTALQDYVPNPQ